jgi:hypothetical protein
MGGRNELDLDLRPSACCGNHELLMRPQPDTCYSD